MIRYWRKDGWVWIMTPYHPLFVHRVKFLIPGYARCFDPTAKVWSCESGYADLLLDTALDVFGEKPTEIPPIPAPKAESRQRQERQEQREKKRRERDGRETGSSKKPSPFAIFMGFMPDDMLKKTYRALVVALHPDRGGSHEDMVALNNAMEEITRRRESRKV